MELNSIDIKSCKKEENKEKINIIKTLDEVKNINKNIDISKEKDRKIEMNRSPNQNNNENINNIIKKEDNINNKNNLQINHRNKFNLNYDYNKLIADNINEKKDQFSKRIEKEKYLDMVNKEVLKIGNKGNENYSKNIIESLSKLQNNEYNYNERYNLGNGLNLNLHNINKNSKNIQDIRIPNINIELEKAFDKKNLQNKGNMVEPSASIVNLNLNLNINNNIINNITTPNKVYNEQNKISEKSNIDKSYIENSKRAISAKPHLRNFKKEFSMEKIKSKIFFHKKFYLSLDSEKQNLISRNKDTNETVNKINVSGLNSDSPIDIKLKKLNNYKKYSNIDKDNIYKNISDNKEINEDKNMKPKVDPFDFDFMLNKKQLIKEHKNKSDEKIKKDDMSDLINYQDSDLNINNFDYLNIKNYNQNNNNNNIKTKSPYKQSLIENNKIENINSTPEISKKIQPQLNHYLNLRNVNSYNKPAPMLNPNKSKENNKYRLNNIIPKSYSRPESAKMPPSIKLTKKLLDNNPVDRRVSPLKNMNLAIDYKNNKNYNNNENIIKNKPRNLTPLKPIESYKSPLLNKNVVNQYIKKNNIPSINNFPLNPTPVRVRPLSGVNPNIGKMNNLNHRNPNYKNPLVSYNKNDPSLNFYNNRNFTPTPSNIKSHRIELDANRRNYGINLSNNVVENKVRAENIYNKVGNIYSNRNNNKNDNYKLIENINLDKLNKRPLPLVKQLNYNKEHDFNNYYNQGKKLENNYNLKIQNANFRNNNNHEYINNLYSNIYAARDKNNLNSNLIQGNRILSGRK